MQNRVAYRSLAEEAALLPSSSSGHQASHHLHNARRLHHWRTTSLGHLYSYVHPKTVVLLRQNVAQAPEYFLIRLEVNLVASIWSILILPCLKNGWTQCPQIWTCTKHMPGH